MEIKSAYVTFEQGKLLLSKGMSLNTKSTFGDNTPMPEQWQVVEWLRVKHRIYVTAQLNHRKKFYWCLDAIGDTSDDYKTPQQAYSAAFDYILKELI